MLRVAFEEARGQYLLNLSLPGVVVARPRLQESLEPWNDRLAQTYRERVRTAFLDAGSPQLRFASLALGVCSPLQLGLLHVEKVVSDALVDVGVLASDRIAGVETIDVYRYANGDRPQWVDVGDRGDRRVRREFFALPAEWRPPMTHGSPAFAGSWVADADEYAHQLDLIAFDAVEREQLSLMADSILRVEAAGHTHWVPRHFALNIEVLTQTNEFDLDNVALFVVDLLAQHLATHGVDTPLDQLVGHVSVRHIIGLPEVRARLSLGKGRGKTAGQ